MAALDRQMRASDEASAARKAAREEDRARRATEPSVSISRKLDAVLAALEENNAAITAVLTRDADGFPPFTFVPKPSISGE
ncbi:hypothetical protein [Burkholderia gladioli]|uniref:hypothetical protein n=1 Tax=Burkholderia gladioli TaxID=28095 RepID=UPI0016413FE9|nr:hypothetical protein [Burkholderia gladioli]